MLSKPLANAIVVVVTMAWLANFIAQFVIPDFKPDQLVNAAFMAIVGGAFAFSRKGKNGDDASDGKHRGGDRP